MPLEESIREPIRSGGGCGDPAIPDEELAETPAELPVSEVAGTVVAAAEDPDLENICNSTNVKEKAHGSVTQQQLRQFEEGVVQVGSGELNYRGFY